jgi:hypothetical protein
MNYSIAARGGFGAEDFRGVVSIRTAMGRLRAAENQQIVGMCEL